MKKQHAEQDAANRNTSGSVSREILTIAIAPGEDKGRGRFADRFSVVVDRERSTWPKSSELAIKRKLVHAIQTTFDTQGFPHQDPVWLVITSKSHEITESLISAVGEVALGQPREVSLADDEIRISLLSEADSIDDRQVNESVERNQQLELQQAVAAGKQLSPLSFEDACDQLKTLHTAINTRVDRLKAATALQHVLSSLFACRDAGTLQEKQAISRMIGEVRQVLRASLIFSKSSGGSEAVSLFATDVLKSGQYRLTSFQGSQPALYARKAFPPVDLQLEVISPVIDLTKATFPDVGRVSAGEGAQPKIDLTEEGVRSATQELAEQFRDILRQVMTADLPVASKKKLSRIAVNTLKASLRTASPTE